MSRHRHQWLRVGGPPDEPWDSNVYLSCVCGKHRRIRCGYGTCTLPIAHDGEHRAARFRDWTPLPAEGQGQP